MLFENLSTPTLVTYGSTLGIGLIFLVMFLRVRVKESNALATVLKAMTSVFFILSWFVLVFMGNKVSPYAMFIGSGLVFGLLGDIWLDLKFCCKPKYEETYTKSGFLCFALGHFAYTGAIITGVVNENAKFDFVSLLPALGVGVFAALVVFFGEKAMKLNYGKYKMISTLYGALLFFTASFALFAVLFNGSVEKNPHLIVFFVAGILFALSDLILSGTYFGVGKRRPIDIVSNHVLYYLAQYLIAASLLFYTP